MSDRASREMKVVGLLVLMLIVCSAPLWAAVGYRLSTRVAACGGLLAAWGGLAIFRPALRVGGPFWGVFNLMSLEIFERFPELVSGSEEYQRLRDSQELIEDTQAMRFGALLVAIGTVLNGFSGFFS
jgi:hypothetical protein